jgi:5-formyltetrahydrofolate cyclo-ligase
MGPDDRVRACRAATSRLLALPELEAARTVAVYASTLEEADPAEALPVLLQRGLRTAFPRVAGPDLEFVPVHDPSELQPGHRGILEPVGPAIDLAEIDVMVVPGLGFDPTGARLGRGGGHYDRTLARVPASVLRVGFCFDEQVVERIPRGLYDQHVHVIVTDRRLIRVPP